MPEPSVPDLNDLTLAPARGVEVPAASAASRLAGYEVIQELGRGGVGVVYKARQLALGRFVALKMILAGAQASADELGRFHAEAAALARLRHPNIVQIHEVGDQGGRPFLALEFVDGPSLQARINGEPQPTASAAALIEVLARATQSAHDGGILHRDLKPANVLLASARGGVPDSSDTIESRVAAVYGIPKITDFGLAKRLGEQSSHTRTGDLLGTPSYMAPEQASGQASEAGPQADVYSLGAILYELLTGRPPFRGASVMETLHQVLTEEPVPPGQLRSKLPKDLERICLKCLEKEPRKRYATAAELADDLRRHMNGETVRARPASAPERVWRWSRRNPIPASLLVAITLGSAFGLWYMTRLSEELVRSSAVEGAAQQAEMLDEMNKYYARVAAHTKGVPTEGHGWEKRPEAIPFPATMTIELGQQISARKESGMQVRVYSDLPFTNRKDGGPRDDFEKRAMEELRRDPTKRIEEFTTLDGKPVLRFATARVLEERCLYCHNNLPDSPRKDWKAGEVRGVLEIIRPLEHDQERVRHGLQGTVAMVAGSGIGLLALCGGVLFLGNRRRSFKQPATSNEARDPPPPVSNSPPTSDEKNAATKNDSLPAIIPPPPHRGGSNMSKPRDPDQNDATMVPSNGSPPRKDGPDSGEVTLIPDLRPDAANDSRVRLNELLDRFESEEAARSANAEAAPPKVDDVDPDEVVLTPDRRSDPSTDSRLRLNQLLDNEELGEVEETLAPPISVDVEQTMLKPPPGAVEQTLVRPDSVVASVAQKIASKIGKKKGAAASTVVAGAVEPTLTEPPKPMPETSGTEVEMTRVAPGVSMTTPESEVTRTIPAPGAARTANRVPAGDRGAERYAVKSLHAKGGLGEVYTARDTELNREVALKRIQSKFADDPASRRRFLAEAEITARLDHPGVVPVFGLVADGNGRPCYAMRFIRGESLRDEILRLYPKPVGQAQPSDKTLPDSAPQTSAPTPTHYDHLTNEHRLAFRQLLQRFIAVCQAIAYAHTRNVIHRDIKPANVMVGAFGETLVVDWGLAKVMGEAADADDPLRQAVQANAGKGQEATLADDATTMGMAVGTPAYMAPEQAAGRVDLVGPPADIYSLGATLYYILTGQAPFTGTNATETIRKVQLGEFVPPQAVNPTVPKALDAVCRKAMAVKIEDRYATALELAADVERWLCDDPVTCYPDPWYARLGRWARRNPARVATAVSLLLTGLIATAAILFVVNGAKAEKEQQLELTQQARDRAENAEKDTRNALGKVQESEKQTKAALAKTKAAQDLARQRFNLAQETFKLLVNDIQGELADRAGTQALRQKLLQKALSGLEAVMKTAEEGKDTDRASADQLLFMARFQMGDVYRGMGQTENASKEYETAAAIAKHRLEAKHPDDVHARNDSARVHDKQSEIALLMGNSDKSLGFNDAAMKEWRSLEAEKAGSAKKELAACLYQRSAILLERGNTPDAHAASLESLSLRKELSKPGDTNASRDHAQSLEREADILQRLGNSKDAIAIATDAVDARRAVAKEFGDKTDRTFVNLDLAASLTRRGDIYRERSELENARKDYNEALKTLNDSLEKDPQSAGAKVQKAAVLSRLSSVQIKLGQAKEGLESARSALVISAELAKDDRGSAAAQRELAAGHERVGEALLANAQPRLALEQFDTAKGLLTGLATGDAGSSRAKGDVARTLELSGQAQLDEGDPQSAVESLKEAVEVRRFLAKADATSADSLRQLAAALDRLADARLQANDPVAAAAAADECLAIYRQTLALDPTNRRAKRDLAGGYARWGEVVDRQGKSTAALILLHDSTEVFGKLQADDQGDVTAKEDRAGGLEKLAAVYKNAGLGPARVDAESEAWQLREKVLVANPNSLIARRAMMTSTRRIGDIQLDDRNLPEARKWYARAAAMPEKYTDDPIFAQEKGVVADRLLLCDAIEKGQKSPLALVAFPARIRAAALVALLEPGREGNVASTESIARLLAELAKEREANYANALAGFGLEDLAGIASRDREEMYGIGRGFAWCAARSTSPTQKPNYAHAAIAYLVEAHRLGFRDADRVRTDWVWGAIKDEADFPKDLRPSVVKPEPK